MMYMKKEFTFDKVAYTSSRRVNLPVIEMELQYKDDDLKKPVLLICGELWNSKHTDAVMSGQCLDDLARLDGLCSNQLFKKLYKLWKSYHLNDLHTWTIKQEQALDKAEKLGIKVCSYEDQCKYLEEVGLLEDNGYKYCSTYLYIEIPEDDLKEIVSLIAE